MAPFPCPALSVAMETCIRSQHQRSQLFSCCPLGPNPVSVSVSGELCLSVGLPRIAGSWLPGQHACGPHRTGQGDVWTQALDLRAASVAHVEGPGLLRGQTRGTQVFRLLKPLQPDHRKWLRNPAGRSHAEAGLPVTTGKMYGGSSE
uniref:Uncharacterized protein n=1 Tax=Rangifer tarandus platyrhynchus TaxID=3082113 RepID=A0ACB0FDP9_RANTA|nr:unnamed protein product [Rangifer tarandus platyrhynchus]